MKMKVFKTIQEQISILESKGLIIDDYLFTEDILIRENYFFISGYRHLFLKSPKDRNFIKGTTFRELYALFNFDRQVRNIVFKNLLIIENNLKSIISYQLSKKYGFREKDYLRPENFTKVPDKQRQLSDTLKKMKRQIRVNGAQHSATSHYLKNYGYIPLWVVVKVLSFGIVGELYTVMKREDQEEIANIYDLSINNLLTYLPILSNYRNLCAHEDIVFDHKTERVIPDTEYHKKLNIFKMDDEYIYGKNDIFSVIIIFKFMLEDDEFRLMIKEFEYEFAKLDAEIDSIPSEKILDTMGIPKNYMNIIDM